VCMIIGYFNRMVHIFMFGRNDWIAWYAYFA